MRIVDDVKLDFKDVLFMPKRSTLASRQQVNLTREYHFKHSKQTWQGIPIMAANMDGVGTISMAKALAEHQLFTTLVKSLSKEAIEGLAYAVSPNNFAISTGTGDKDWHRIQKLLDNNTSFYFICIDVANGYSEHFGDFVTKVRHRYPHHTIIAGNVVTADMTQELILRGADIIKVGIGPGSVCTTRKQTGVGYPQLSAIIECADAAHGLGGHIVSDGGCTNPGDIAKAFGAGADFVMLGGMLAGHDEGEGELHTEYYLSEQIDAQTKQPLIEARQMVQFYGMSSDVAMKKHAGGVAEYRSSEGKVVRIPYRGSINATVLDILGGLRSTCTYVGAPTLKQLSKCTTFVRVTQQVNTIFSS
jgi:GMP reductase